MKTTRSMYVVLSPPRPPDLPSRRSPPPRCGPAIRCSSSQSSPCSCSSLPASSEAQAFLARTVGQGRDATGVPVATAVEDDLGDAGALRALRDELADLTRLGGLVAG